MFTIRLQTVFLCIRIEVHECTGARCTSLLSFMRMVTHDPWSGHH